MVEAKAARWTFCVATVSTTSLGSRDGGSETCSNPLLSVMKSVGGIYCLNKGAKRC